MVLDDLLILHDVIVAHYLASREQLLMISVSLHALRSSRQVSPAQRWYLYFATSAADKITVLNIKWSILRISKFVAFLPVRCLN